MITDNTEIKKGFQDMLSIFYIFENLSEKVDLLSGRGLTPLIGKVSPKKFFLRPLLKYNVYCLVDCIVFICDYVNAALHSMKKKKTV